MDPDDVIKNMGADGYRNLLAEAMPLIDFKLDILKRTYDVSTVDGKRKYVTNALKVVRESASSAEQEDLLKVICDQTKITFEALKRELYSIEDKPREEKIVTPQFNDNVGDKTAIAARYILAAYLFSKPYAKETDISELEFNASVYKEIQQYIKEKYSAGQRPQFSDLYELLEDEYSEEISRIAGMEAEENKNFDHAAYFFDCVRTLKRDAIDKKIAKLSEMFESEIDTEKRGNLTAEMTRLLIEKRKLI